MAGHFGISIDRQTVALQLQRHIESAIRIQSRDVVARHAEHTRESAADEYLAVGLNRVGSDNTAQSVEIESLIPAARLFRDVRCDCAFVL